MPKIKTVTLDLLNKKDLHKFLKSKEFKESGLSDTDKEIYINNLNTYYKDCSAKKRTIDNKHNGEAYYKDKTKPIDGVKTGEIDEMFINEAGKQDGGAIQFITPFSINQLQEINLLREIK